MSDERDDDTQAGIDAAAVRERELRRAVRRYCDAHGCLNGTGFAPGRIIGVGEGIDDTGNPAIHVYAITRQAERELRREPATFDGFPVKVCYSGRMFPA